MNHRGKQALTGKQNLLRSSSSFRPWLTGRSWIERIEFLHPILEFKRRDPFARDADLAKLEAVLFLADEPLGLRKLSSLTGIPTGKLPELLNQLKDWLLADESSFVLSEIADGYQLRVPPEFYPWIHRILGDDPETPPSQSALETLTIIAYKQPIMRADVESIRGVSCGELIAQLLERGLIRTAGRHDSLGRPMLYGTTKKFLQLYGLKSLKELPG
jgi:segregation and condensation protein B